MHCTNCGKKLSEGAKFCDACGTRVATSDDDTTRKVKYTGEIHKCPNCGEVLKSFETTCPACGHEIRNSKASDSLKEFTRKLEALETQRENQKINNIVTQALTLGKSINKTDEKKISLIRSYSIPNNKEDIAEFIILASSNIRFDAYSQFSMTTTGIMNASEKAVSDAWLAKMEQAYQKARISFGKDPQFENIKDLYESTIHKVNKKKQFKKRLLMFIVIGIIAIYAIIGIFAWLESASSDKSGNSHLNIVAYQVNSLSKNTNKTN